MLYVAIGERLDVSVYKMRQLSSLPSNNFICLSS